MFQKGVHSPGRFDLVLDVDTPNSIRKALVERGHVIFTKVPVDVRRMSDAEMKAMSVFTGRLLVAGGGLAGDTQPRLQGDHVTAWLGDNDGRGDIISVTQTYNNTPWSTFVNAILPPSIVAGTITNTPGNVSLEVFATTPRAALESGAELLLAEYRVNDDGTLDSGVASELYVVTPTTLLTRKGDDFDPVLKVRSSPSMDSTRDASRWVGEIWVAGKGDFANGGDDILIGHADLTDIAKTNPYKDLHGNADGTAAVVNDPVSFASQGDTKAQTLLGKASELADTITLDLNYYDVNGDFEVGDQVWVYDPPLFEDSTTAVNHRGEWITPKAIRVFDITVPTQSQGVYYRDLNGNYTDLTPYVQQESGTTRITVGERFRSPFDQTNQVVSSLVSALNLPSNATTTPNVPTKINTPWNTVSYLDGNGNTRARILVEWATPTNTDTTTITDGNHYLVRYRRSGETQYQYVSVAWGTNEMLIQDLSPAVTYQISVAAYDHAGRTSGFGTDETVAAAVDSIAPSQPAAPSVASSPLALQVTHQLGLNTGGTYNLESDLDHLNVYADTTTGVTAIEANKLGQIPVTSANLALGIAAIGVFEIPDATQRFVAVTAVDKTGNESAISPEATATADLIDTVHIANAAITTALIGDLQVTGAKIANATIVEANIDNLAVTDAKIASLDGSKINADTITARELIVGSFDNLIHDGIFELGADTTPIHVLAPNGGAFASGTGAPYAGTRALRFDVDSQAGTASVVFNGVASNPEWHPTAAEDDEFYFEVWFRYADTAPTTDPVVRIQFRDKDGVSIQDNGTAATGITTTYQRFGHSAVAPAGTRYVLFYVTWPSGSPSTSAWLVDGAYARRKVGSALFESVWSHDITLAGAGAFESDNYVAGSAGFRLTGAGFFELNDGTIRITNPSSDEYLEFGANTSSLKLGSAHASEVTPGSLNIEDLGGGGVSLKLQTPSITGFGGGDITFNLNTGGYSALALSANQVDGFNLRAIAGASSVPFMVKSSVLESSEVLRISSAGAISILDTTPDAVIDIGSTSGMPSNLLAQWRSSETNAVAAIISVRADYNVANEIKFQVLADGDVLNRTGVYGTISDARLKDKRTIRDADREAHRRLLLDTRIRSYKLKGHDERMVGVVAQELAEVAPGLVEEGEARSGRRNGEPWSEDGFLSVKSSLFPWFLVSGFQLHEEALNDLAERLNRLESQGSVT